MGNPTRDFYHSIGAHGFDKTLPYRIGRAEMMQLAGAEPPAMKGGD